MTGDALRGAGACAGGREARRSRQAVLAAAPLDVHQAPQPSADIPVGVVDPSQVPVYRGRLNSPSALLELSPERVKLAEHGGTPLATLELGETLLEIVQKAGGVGFRRRWNLGRRRGRWEEAQMDKKRRVLPPLKSTAPGNQAHGLKLTWDRSRRSSPNRPIPTIAAIIPNLRML